MRKYSLFDTKKMWIIMKDCEDNDWNQILHLQNYR